LHASKEAAMSESNVFVVRVWRGAEAFRATARAVDSDRTSVFCEPDALLRFLATGQEAPAPVARKPRSEQRTRVPSRGTKRDPL
jgi:hypothetical protein